MENNQPIEQLTKKERKELRYQERNEKRQSVAKQRSIKRMAKIALAVIVIGGSIGAFIWYLASRPPVPEGEIISRAGIHWHSEITIFAKGEKQTIPANIGIDAMHHPVHTHDSSGVIHLEFQGLVRQDDVKLGRLFEIWGKDFMEFGSSVGMTVNREESSELQNYRMKDGDKIELKYQ